ncbi:kinesin-domain-containing protein [Boletus edulis]|nr:kinesin-domain-containing protein [Boletus edulis]
MAGRAKAPALAIRTSTRTKTPPAPSPSPPPAIKAIKAKASTRSMAAGVSGTKTTVSKKPLKNRANSPDPKPVAPKRAGKPLFTKSAIAEQEPIMGYYRASTTPPSTVYKFSHVFLPSTQQDDFFANTTLPLVHSLLDGQNGLIFAYGVTNSGKTYTIQGSNKPGSGGILPRTLDIIFNSVEGLQSDGRHRPVRLYGVGEADPSDFTPPLADLNVPSEPALAETDSDVHADPTVIKLDRNYEYSVWISYVEVYNEKVYDLLASVNDGQGNGVGGIPPNTTNVPGQGANPVIVTRKALAVKPCPAHDALDDRYILGLKQFRVSSAAQAKSLVKLGQLHRRVFRNTCQHIITIKILRNHRGDRDDPSSVQISRLTLVDLAGSERTKHTQTTGDRLKEAGNINKSLMVLGQCMEVMRSNQQRLAQSLANPGRSDTRDIKRVLAVVPFRHSKLTEILMDYFAGDGRVIMIVNVNPYDTGFDENSHVMKFSALAREVSTVVNNGPVPRVHTSPTKPSATTRQEPSGLPRAITRKVTISSFGAGKKLSEAHLEVFEEDEEVNDDQEGDSDDEPINPLVDALFDEIEDLRLRLYEAEMRCAIVEAETREEVMKEMEERMRAVERTYATRLMSEVERNERKMDAKIDMLHQAGLLGTAKKPAVLSNSESEIEDIIKDSEPEDSGQEYGTDAESEMPSSPLHRKGNPLTSKTMEYHNPQTQTDASRSGKMNDHANDAISQSTDEDEDAEDAVSANDDGSDDYIPPAAAKSSKSYKRETRDKVLKKSTGKRSTRSVSKLEQEIKGLSIAGDALAGADDSVVILPNRKLRKAAVEAGGPGVEYVPGKGEVDPVKKKKRQLGKKNIVTEDEVEEVVGAMEHRSLRKTVRRMRAS